MKVRIVNDGQPSYHTQITNVETGERIERVTDVRLYISAQRELPEADITVIMPHVDVIADAEVKQVCPCCGTPKGQGSMRIEVIRCDTCNKEHDALYVLPPHEWLRVVQTAQSQYGNEEEKHFCSKACLISWASEEGKEQAKV